MKYNKIIFVALMGLAMVSCKLDRTPLDPNTDTQFNKDAVFAKCYATFGVTGQKGPDGNGDVDGIDEGTSSFYRLFWELNEFCTDEGWWVWNDAGLADIRTCTWDKDNSLVEGLYYRFYFDITLCNSFLDNTVDYTDAETMAQRAEVRMIRAINYYYLLDMFYSVPFSTTVSPDKAKPYTRPELFAWLETELKELADDPNIVKAGQRTNKYRVDQACAWFMLMRLYLNAKVYNETALGALDGEARWDDAEIYAKKLIDESGYKLHGTASSGENPAAVDLAKERTSDHVYFSAYQQLFMGDNDTNGAQDEAILLIYQDAKYCQSWGGARFLLNTFRDANYVPSGSNDSWSCFRTSPEFVYLWWNNDNTAKDESSTIFLNEYQMPVKLADDRAIMASVLTDGTTLGVKGNQSTSFKDCWSVLKFTGIYSTAESVTLKDVNNNDSIVGAPWNWVSPSGEAAWPDTDIPLFRLAEAYMSMAEIRLRQGDMDGAKYYINTLRRRAQASELTRVDSEIVLKEWCKEFYCEGRRRTDLIRFGQFCGNNTKSWEGHKVGIDAKYNVFPIPAKDENANENLKEINTSIGY